MREWRSMTSTPHDEKFYGGRFPHEIFYRFF